MALSVNYIMHIREEFKRKYKNKEFKNGTVEIQNAMFKVDGPSIFGAPNEEYIQAEIEWYETMSRSVDDLASIYGKRVAIWDSVACNDMEINSNYGWCIYSKQNGDQYVNVMRKLYDAPDSRQAVMIYTDPDMHDRATDNDRSDFMCTNTVQYFINDGYLECTVNMRSNDAVFGFNNDVAWQKHVLQKLADDLSTYSDNVKPGVITWVVGSLHVYERHYHLIK